MGLKGLRISVEDTPIVTLDRATIDKSGVMGLCGHVFGARVGRHWSHDTPVSEPDGSVTRRFLLSPEVRSNRKGRAE
jgi:hypothetical protein